MIYSARLHALPLRLVVAGVVGILSGVAALIVSPIAVLAALVGFYGLWIVIRLPELALLGLLIGTSTIFPESAIPFIPIGPGRLYVTDVLLVVPLGVIILRRMFEPQFRVNTPLDLPLVLFLGLALLTTGLGLFRASMAYLNTAIPETRTMVYYMTFFSVTHLVDDERKLKRLLGGLFVLAVVNAGAMLIQYLAGDSLSLLTHGRIEPLVTEGKVYTGVTRITSFGGEPIIVIMLIVGLVAFFVGESRSPLHLLADVALLTLLVVALMITFNRNFFVMVSIALVLLVFVLLGRGQHGNRLARRIVAYVLALTVFVWLLTTLMPASTAARLLDASFERARSLVEQDTYTRTGSSLRSRDLENRYALEQVARHPVWGLGLGAAYRPFISGVDDPASAGIMQRYLHNAHLALLVKTGVPAYLAFLALSWRFINRGFRHWNRLPSGWKQAVVLGFTLAYAGLLIAALVNPILVQWFWTPVLGVMWGASEVLLQQRDRMNGTVPRSVLPPGSWRQS